MDGPSLYTRWEQVGVLGEKGASIWTLLVNWDQNSNLLWLVSKPARLVLGGAANGDQGGELEDGPGDGHPGDHHWKDDALRSLLPRSLCVRLKHLDQQLVHRHSPLLLHLAPEHPQHRVRIPGTKVSESHQKLAAIPVTRVSDWGRLYLIPPSPSCFCCGTWGWGGPTAGSVGAMQRLHTWVPLFNHYNLSICTYLSWGCEIPNRQ